MTGCCGRQRSVSAQRRRADDSRFLHKKAPDFSGAFAYLVFGGFIHTKYGSVAGEDLAQSVQLIEIAIGNDQLPAIGAGVVDRNPHFQMR